MMKAWLAVVLGMLFAVVLLTQTHAAGTGSTAAGGVQICGLYYDCGYADGVCPSSFGATCLACDPDCGSATTWYRDADTDGYGTPLTTQSAVCQPGGFINNNLDCNDGSAAVRPGVAELCTDEIDNNCNGIINEGCAETTLAQCNDGIDNDWDGQRDFNDAGCSMTCSAANCVAVVPGGVSAPNPICQVADPDAFPPPPTDPNPNVEYLRGSDYRPGSPSAYRLDCDGAAGASSCWCPTCAPGYSWNGAACVDLACLGPGPSITSFTAAPVSPDALTNVVLTLTGSTSTGAGTFEIDTNRDPSVYESSGASSPFSAVSMNVPAGTHTYYARITDACPTPRTATQTVQVTINPNTAPSVTLTPTVTQRWGGADVVYSYVVSDNRNSMNINFDYGNSLTYADPSTASSVSRTLPTRTYSTGTYTATLTATDSGSPVMTTTRTAAINAVGLPCVTGTQTGAATYDNDPAQCCSTACAAQVSGVWSCFATTACFPSNNTMCGGATSPPTWVDRDNDMTTCESSSASCTQFIWADIHNVCIDDPGEYAARWVFPPGPIETPPANNNNARCFAPNQCYTTAGAPGCYNGVENTTALCTDGNDNDCDGQIDAWDADCQPGSLYGQVMIDSQGSLSVGIGANVTINGIAARKTTDTNGNYSFTGADLVGATPGNRPLYAFKFGYTTHEQTVNFQPGLSYNIDFVLQPRRCNADCTNDQGFCDASCIGVGECQPTGPELATLNACHPAGAEFGLKKGTEVILGENPATEQVLVGICCTVPAAWRDAPQATVIDAGSSNVNMERIDTLVKYTRLITLNGKTYRLVISTW